MRDRLPQIIDMTTGGEFATRPVRPDWTLRVGLGAAAVAALAGAFALAALFLWVASVLLPVALFSAAVAYAALRLGRWQRRRQMGVPSARHRR